MDIIKTKDKLKVLLNIAKQGNRKIGFVPTMGALHEGHLSLLTKAKAQNDIVVCSVFVNPTQFNNKEDLLKYPRTLEKDICLLENTTCNILFCPDEKEMYPNGLVEKDFNIDFGNLGKVMEGEFRPGHFQGVATIVKKFFDIINPDNAYFGEKDYQQMAIIKMMVKKMNLKINIVPCPIIREESGLAMSSRNERLTQEERQKAAIIYKTLLQVKEMAKTVSVAAIKDWVENVFEAEAAMRLDYFEICDEEALQPLQSLKNNNHKRGFIAVFVGDVRLIDNFAL